MDISTHLLVAMRKLFSQGKKRRREPQTPILSQKLASREVGTDKENSQQAFGGLNRPVGNDPRPQFNFGQLSAFKLTPQKRPKRTT